MIGDFKVNNEIIKKNIFDLKPHQKNTQIYGINEDVSDIKASILSDGFITQLTISENNTIISGHRRWKALTELVNEGHSEFTTVNCIVKHYETAEDELKAVIIENSTRNKNLEQIGREALILKEIHSLEAEKRMKVGKKSDPMADSPKGSTRDLIAQELHSTGNGWITPKNIDVLLQSITKLDELEKNGDSLNADVLRHELHKDKHNFTAISKLTKNIDNISAENKQKLLDNEITVNDAVKAIESVSETSSDEISTPKTPDELLKVINAFRKLPEYNNSTIRGIFAEIAYNVMSIEKVNNVLNGEFKQIIQPILDLGLWKKIKYFSDRSTDCMAFTIIKVFALAIGNRYGYDDDFGYDSSYDVDKELIDLANNVINIEHEKCTAKYETARKRQQQYIEDKKNRYNNGLQLTTQLFNQFDKCICNYTGEISDDVQEFLDDCNTPHVVMALNRYYSVIKEYDLSSDEIPFLNILCEFINSDDKEGYDYDIDYEIYSNSNVFNRQDSIDDFISEYIDDYYTETIKTEEAEEDD